MFPSKKIIIIGNPVAGGGALKKIRKAEGILKSEGFDVSLRLTSRKGDAEFFARQIATPDRIPPSENTHEQRSRETDTLVIAAGGDGTYNEVANGLINSTIPLAILPLGTTSVLAKELRIPPDTEKALDVALSGKPQAVHLGRISYQPRTSGNAGPSLRGDRQVVSPPITRHFLLMAGMGYDADAVLGVNEQVKKYSGKAAYILSGIGVIFNYRPAPLAITAKIESPGDIESGRFRLYPGFCSVSGNILKSTGYIAIISKAACYGGNFKIAPDASLTSPYLYVFVTHKRGKTDLMRYLSAIIGGRTLDLDDISYFRTGDITVEGSSNIQLDGDYAGTAPAKIDVIRDALNLVVPVS